MKKAPLVMFVCGIAGIVVGLGLIFASLASTGFRSCGSGRERFGGYQVAPPCPHFTKLVLTWVWLVFTLAIPLTVAGGILRSRQSAA